MLDHKKLAVIHIVKKELDLTDKEYRDTLEKITGVRSAKELDERSFRRLMNYFARSRHYRINIHGLTFRQKMYIRHLVEDLGWDDRHFRNFLHKYYHKNETESLTKLEASKVINGLKRILTRNVSDKTSSQSKRA